MVFVEADYVAKRVNGGEVTRALLLQAAISSVLSSKGGDKFNEMLKDLGSR